MNKQTRKLQILSQPSPDLEDKNESFAKTQRQRWITSIPARVLTWNNPRRIVEMVKNLWPATWSSSSSRSSPCFLSFLVFSQPSKTQSFPFCFAAPFLLVSPLSRPLFTLFPQPPLAVAKKLPCRLCFLFYLYQRHHSQTLTSKVRMRVEVCWASRAIRWMLS